jgi:glutathione S-transferase
VSLPVYELYIANKNYSSWSLRPWVLMRERGIAFTERLVHFAQGPGGASWKAFRTFSPNGKVPCLRDGERIVWDSLAITEYLAERHEGLWPADTGARSWARCAAAEMHSGFATLRDRCTFNAGIRVRIDRFGDALNQDIARIGELWSEGLSRFGGPFLAGNTFTAVDAFFAPVAFRVQTYGLKLDAAANGYASHLLALPSMRSWYDAALKETFRDLAHEEEARKTGTWLEDLRAT